MNPRPIVRWLCKVRRTSRRVLGSARAEARVAPSGELQARRRGFRGASAPLQPGRLVHNPDTIGRGRPVDWLTGFWLAGTLGYILTQIKSRSPARQGNRTRPGAADLWQAVYLGTAEVFVTSDVRQREAVSEISGVLRYPRCVVDTADLFAGIERGVPDPAAFCHRRGSALAAPPAQRGFDTTA